MKALIFIRDIFRKFPVLLIGNTLLLLAVSVFSACSLFTVSPLIDFLVKTEPGNINPITQKAIRIMELLGLPITLGSWLVVFIFFITLASVFQVFARYSILKTKYAVLRDIMVGSFKDFFNSSWRFFSGSRQGVLLNSLNRELAVVGDAFGAMALFFANILQAVFFLAVPIYLSWQVTMISLGAALLFAVPFILLGKFSYRLGIANTRTANKLSSIIQENFSLAKVVLGFGNQEKSIDNLGTAFNAHRIVTLRSQILKIAIPLLYRPFGVVMIAIALLAARYFNVSLSQSTVLILALYQVAVSIGNLAMQKNSLENFFPSYEQISRLREYAKDLRQISGARGFAGFVHEISAEGLYFAYPEQGPVLIDINMRIPKGKMVAIVGESGTGKSTLIDMIMGFYEPTAGRITLDSISLQDFDIVSYRRRIGYVPQDSILFNMTIKDNLLWACKEASDEDISQACIQANAHEFIKELPEGYNTLVGDRGVRLSGGQVQRIALARAILRKPELLILDEATSSLDTHSEKMIQQAIENIARETTVIIIAHRLSTIVNADYTYVLKNGRIAEEGTYSDLLKRDGHFNRMVKLQVLETSE